MSVKVWLGGEGSCELGGRADKEDRCGVIEALLLRIEPSGWAIEGATRWKHIRKFKSRGALETGENHGDIRNVLGLALEAFEAACEVLAFTRDTDADHERVEALRIGMERAAEVFPLLKIVGGPAVPAIEGWILALRGIARTDEMSRQKTLDELRSLEIFEKSPERYVQVVEEADLERLPTGCESLASWLQVARTVMAAAIRGTS